MCYNKAFGGGLPCPVLKRCSNVAQTVLNTDAQAVFVADEGAHGREVCALRRSRLSLPLGGRWHGAAPRRTVTDEGSPPTAGLTAARAFAIL